MIVLKINVMIATSRKPTKYNTDIIASDSDAQTSDAYFLWRSKKC